MKKAIISTILFVLLLGSGFTANAQCKADFQFFTSCNTVQFYDSSNTSSVFNTYLWTFGDGTSDSSTAYPKHTYAKTGTYTVTLYVTAYDSFRKVVCRDTAVKTLTISSKCCKADFSYQVNGLDVYFYNNSTAGTTASWNFGDGTTTKTSPHTYSKAGTYSVCLIISDSSGSCKDTICKNVTVTSSSCTASFTWTQPDTTKTEIKFTSTSTPSGLNHFWSFGDGSSSYSTNPTHTYNTTGPITVCLTVYDSSRTCTKRYCAVVNIKGKSCRANFTYSNGGNGIVYFRNQGSLYHDYKWDLGDGSSSTDAHPKHQYSKPGKYTVCLVVSDSAKSCIDSICKTVVVDSSSCDASFTMTVDSATKKVTFTPAKSDSSTYHDWYIMNGGRLGNSSTAFSKTFAKGGTYTVCHYIAKRDSNSFCSDTFCSTFTLPIDSACNATFTYQITDTTKRIVKFTSNAKGSNIKYSWSFGDGTSSSSANPTHTYSKNGTFYVYLSITVSDSNNRVICSDSSMATIYFRGQNTSCRAKYRAIADSTTKFKILIINQSTGAGLSYYWSFGDGGSSTAKNPKHKYKTFGLYQVCLTVVDSTRLCTSTYCDTIGMDSTGKMLKAEGFEIEVIDENSTSVAPITLSNAKLYPNPFTNQIRLVVDQTSEELGGVKMLNSQGQLLNVAIQRDSKHSVTINTSHLPKGIYLINYEHHGILQTKRIVKVE